MKLKQKLSAPFKPTILELLIDRREEEKVAEAKYKEEAY